MASWRRTRGLAWVVLGTFGCRSGRPDVPATDSAAKRAIESPDAALARHRAALAEARAAAEAEAHAVARERIARAVATALVEIGEREDAPAIALLEEMGRFAQDASDPRSSEKALGRVLAVRDLSV